jgi:hypothetical protein
MEAWRKNIFTTQNSHQQVQTSKPPLRKKRPEKVRGTWWTSEVLLEGLDQRNVKKLERPLEI